MRNIFILLSLLYSLSFYGQNEHKPILKEGRVWYMANIHKDLFADTIDTLYYSIMIDGDTIIDDVHYKVIRYKESNGMGGGESVYSLAYEENSNLIEKCKYCDILQDCIHHQHIVLDFSLSMNGKWLACAFEDCGENFEYGVEVKSTDTIEVKGVRYKRLVLASRNYDGRFNVVVEGIGMNDSYNLYYKFILPSSPDGQIYWDEILSVYDEGECIFEQKDFYADAVHAEANSISASEAFASPSHIYDLVGRRLKSVPKTGMYIQDGKVKVALSR